MDHQRFMQALAAQIDDIASRCTRCGRCVEVCPMPQTEGLDLRAPAQVVDGVVSALSGHEAPGDSQAWMQACTGSGHCIDACPEGINPRQMLTLARVAQREQSEPLNARRKDGAAQYRAMSRGVKVLSRLQLAPDQIARLQAAGDAGHTPDPDVVFYTGCNILKTPHIVLLCLDVLDALGVRYRLKGGPSECCGVYQLRGADPGNSARLAANTFSKLSEGASEVLSWCPSCQVTFGDFALPVYDRAFGEMPFTMNPFILFLARHLERLQTLFIHRIEKRIALHEHSGVPGVHEAVKSLLRAVPGVELVELDGSKLGYMCTSLGSVPATRQAVHAAELEAAKAAGVDMLVGVYHACHRDLCVHERDWPFEVVNCMELIGRAMGLTREDRFKQLKMMQDVDAIVAASADRIAENGLDPEEVREVVARDMLGEQSLKVGVLNVGAQGSMGSDSINLDDA